MLTNREIFDRVKTHLLKQNAVAATAYGCVYGDAFSGRRCAVGCLLPLDVAITLPITGLHAANEDGRAVMAALRAHDVPVDDAVTLRLLQSLQEVHDTYDPAEWPHFLDEVAAEFDL